MIHEKPLIRWLLCCLFVLALLAGAWFTLLLCLTHPEVLIPLVFNGLAIWAMPETPYPEGPGKGGSFCAPYRAPDPQAMAEYEREHAERRTLAVPLLVVFIMAVLAAGFGYWLGAPPKPLQTQQREACQPILRATPPLYKEVRPEPTRGPVMCRCRKVDVFVILERDPSRRSCAPQTSVPVMITIYLLE